MRVVADRTRIENGKAMAIDSGMNGNSDRFELWQDDAKESPIGMPASVPFEQHERSNRLDVKLRRELGEQVLALLADERTEDIVLNPDSSLWVKRMGEGFVRFGNMAPERAASALGTVAAWRETVLNHEHPILETELPIDGSRFEGITAPVVRQPVFAIRLRPRKIFSLDEYEAGGIVHRQRRSPQQASLRPGFCCFRARAEACGDYPRGRWRKKKHPHRRVCRQW